jgi:DNA-binding response OmpR family regulator
VKILLVDDEKELVSAMAERLSFRGFEVDWATGGEKALSMAREKDYDLAVLDVKMPRLGGIELKQKLEEEHPGMKFIFLTGHGSEEDFRTGSAEADFYLVKPVKIDALVKKINESLAGKGNGEEAS